MLDCYCKTSCGYLVRSLICFQFMTVFPVHLTLYVNSLISAVKETSSSNLRISQSMLFAVCLSYPWLRLRELGVAYCQSFAVLIFLHGSSILHNSSNSFSPPPLIVVITITNITITTANIIFTITILSFSCRVPTHN